MKSRQPPLTSRSGSPLALLAVVGAGTLLLSGCGVTAREFAATTPVTIPTATKVTGIIMGGQQPVAGVSLQLYAAGTTGYGSAATALFTPGSVLTTAAGNFTFPTFTCPTPTSLVYLVGTGGTPIGGSQNNNLSLMAGLGACSTAGSTFIDINEITTVATVYALSGFMTGPANIGAPASNLAGIQNAFAAINKVVNIATGAPLGPRFLEMRRCRLRRSTRSAISCKIA